ncbi:MAG: 3-hydroxyacyl-CoA dehydrogenase NAD-binding domain-containing protein, partial [Pseudomonadota bacterium]|nr:3-hydroxyacyl-CoA dehydrogenase NAD-binding domain-containing protein [Pseudomonadota bacterium]
MIEVIGIIGAGQMGNGIAHVSSVAGYNVQLLDMDQERLDAALATIEKNMVRQVRRTLLSDEDKVAALGRIQTSLDYDSFGDCDIVIEAAAEDESVKREIFKTLVPHLGEKTLIASNTSSISITRLATITDRPERFIGMHFMNPVPMMKLVELIRGLATSDETFEEVRAL